MDLTEFKEIQNFENYKISKKGEIYSLKSKKLLKLFIKNGYKTICLINNGKKKFCTVSRLVAETFIPNPNKYSIVNHINEDKLDNRVENLEWCTQKHNVKHSNKNDGSSRYHTNKVNKYHKDTKEFIETFDSIQSAAESIGLSRHSITKVCKGQNPSAGGFFWKYVDEIVDIKDENEEFKEINNYPNYLISNLGNVKSVIMKRNLKPVINRNGQQYVTLCKERKKKNMYIQQLVALHFIENVDNKKYVRHIDGDKLNNKVDNLEWY